MANVLFTRTDDPSTKAITDGQIILSTAGDGNIYLDNGTTRLKMGGDAESRVKKNDVVQSLANCRVVASDKIAESVPSVAVIKEIDNALGGVNGVDIRINPETGEPEWSQRGADSFSPFKSGGSSGSGNRIGLIDSTGALQSVTSLTNYNIISICDANGIDFRALTSESFVSDIIDANVGVYNAWNGTSPKLPNATAEKFEYDATTGNLTYKCGVSYKNLGTVYFTQGANAQFHGITVGYQNGTQTRQYDAKIDDSNSYNGALGINVGVKIEKKVNIYIIKPTISSSSSSSSSTSSSETNSTSSSSTTSETSTS